MKPHVKELSITILLPSLPSHPSPPSPLPPSPQIPVAQAMAGAATCAYSVPRTPWAIPVSVQMMWTLNSALVSLY